MSNLFRKRPSEQQSMRVSRNNSAHMEMREWEQMYAITLGNYKSFKFTVRALFKALELSGIYKETHAFIHHQLTELDDGNALLRGMKRVLQLPDSSEQKEVKLEFGKSIEELQELVDGIANQLRTLSENAHTRINPPFETADGVDLDGILDDLNAMVQMNVDLEFTLVELLDQARLMSESIRNRSDGVGVNSGILLLNKLGELKPTVDFDVKARETLDIFAVRHMSDPQTSTLDTADIDVMETINEESSNKSLSPERFQRDLKQRQKYEEFEDEPVADFTALLNRFDDTLTSNPGNNMRRKSSFSDRSTISSSHHRQYLGTIDTPSSATSSFDGSTVPVLAKIKARQDMKHPRPEELAYRKSDILYVLEWGKPGDGEWIAQHRKGGESGFVRANEFDIVEVFDIANETDARRQSRPISTNETLQSSTTDGEESRLFSSDELSVEDFPATTDEKTAAKSKSDASPGLPRGTDDDLKQLDDLEELLSTMSRSVMKPSSASKSPAKSDGKKRPLYRSPRPRNIKLSPQLQRPPAIQDDPLDLSNPSSQESESMEQPGPGGSTSRPQAPRRLRTAAAPISPLRLMEEENSSNHKRPPPNSAEALDEIPSPQRNLPTPPPPRPLRTFKHF